MKRFFDLNYNGEPYDAVARRKGQDLYYIEGGNKVAAPGKGQAKPVSYKPSGGAKTIGGPKTSGVSASAGISSSKPKVGGGAAVHAGGSDSEQVKMLQAELQELKLNMNTIEKERDFYFGKLRDIELFLQTNPS